MQKLFNIKLNILSLLKLENANFRLSQLILSPRTYFATGFEYKQSLITLIMSNSHPNTEPNLRNPIMGLYNIHIFFS